MKLKSNKITQKGNCNNNLKYCKLGKLYRKAKTFVKKTINLTGDGNLTMQCIITQ